MTVVKRVEVRVKDDREVCAGQWNASILLAYGREYREEVLLLGDESLLRGSLRNARSARTS